MQNTRPQTPMGHLWNSMQSWLFPMLEDEIGALDEKHRQFVAVCELCAPQDHMTVYRWCGNGCPPHDRLALCKAYIAKAVWDFATTRDLIDAVRHRQRSGSARSDVSCGAWLCHSPGFTA